MASLAENEFVKIVAQNSFDRAGFFSVAVRESKIQ
jgi:hypothetical protein